MLSKNFQAFIMFCLVKQCFFFLAKGVLSFLFSFSLKL